MRVSIRPIIVNTPIAYQLIGDWRVGVLCGYCMDGTLSYGFWLGQGYDLARELIIDPL